MTINTSLTGVCQNGGSAIATPRKENSNLNGLYVTPPDLFVKELTRECIQATITDLLKKGDLEKVLNPSCLSLKTNNT